MKLFKRRVTAKSIAKEFGLEYLPDFCLKDLNNTDGGHLSKFLMYEKRYLLIHPPNDGRPFYVFEWYTKTTDGVLIKVIDNQTAFSSITNLNEIIKQIADIYLRYLDEDICIYSYNFVLKLEGDICKNYKGKASLAIPKFCVKKGADLKAGLNKFLDHFIGWNFGKVVQQDLSLQRELESLNQLAIKKGKREYAGTGFGTFTKDEANLKGYFLRCE